MALGALAASSSPVCAQSAYEPFGVRLGNVNLFPDAGVTLSYNDNVFSDRDNKQSDFVRAFEAGFNAETDWSRHKATAEAQITNSVYLDNTVGDRNSLYGKLTGRIDITADDTLTLLTSIRRNSTLSGFNSLDSSSPASGDGQPGENPDENLALPRQDASLLSQDPSLRDDQRIEYDDTLLQTSYERDVNDLKVRVSGSYHTLDYNNEQANDLDRGDIRLTTRVTYSLSPSLGIYVQPSLSWQRFDTADDRDSRRQSLLVGTTFNLSAIWIGDVGIGFTNENFRSDTLPDESNLALNARLTWTPSALTKVTFLLLRQQEADIRVSSSGSVTTSLETRVTHDFMSNLSAEIFGGYALDEYSDKTQDRRTARFSLNYLLGRNLVLTAKAEHRERVSDDPNDEYDQNILSIGLKARL